MPTDDLGDTVPLPRPARRVVSLVPSLTEALAATSRPILAGATDWCTHPAGLDVPRVRGTKNPDVRRVVDLAPDLVVANQEENRRLDVERLRAAGVPVWVTRIDSVDEALHSMARLLTEALDLPEPEWLARARAAWSRPPQVPGVRVAVAIWRDPWMWVGGGTYADDVLTRLGAVDVGRELADRYPAAGPEVVAALAPDVLLLPDEPYAFSATDGPESVPNARLVEGRPLFWYGPAMVDAPRVLADALRPVTRA